MYYIDTDVLIHSLIKQNQVLHVTVKSLLKRFIGDNTLIISWISVQEAAFVLGKLDQPSQFIKSSLSFLIQLQPMQYGRFEFERATELAEQIGYKNFNDCLHLAIAEQHCSAFYTCNIKDFKKLEPHTSLTINFIK